MHIVGIDFSILLNANYYVAIKWGAHEDPAEVIKLLERSIGSLSLSLMPNRIVMCTDTGPSWRHDYIQGYKAGRPERKDFRDVAKAVTAHFREHYGLVEIDTAEADDIAWCVAKYARSKGYKCTLVSADADYEQMTLTGAEYYDYRQKRTLSVDAYRARFDKLMQGCKTDVVPSLLKPRFKRADYDKFYDTYLLETGGKLIEGQKEYDIIEYLRHDLAFFVDLPCYWDNLYTVTYSKFVYEHTVPDVYEAINNSLLNFF